MAAAGDRQRGDFLTATGAILLTLDNRHYLEMPYAFNGGTYTIVNMRTYESFHWDFWGNIGGTGKFGVSTWYAFTHPGGLRTAGTWFYPC
jgi:hypothetical protein